jgi:hypothetical protein
LRPALCGGPFAFCRIGAVRVRALPGGNEVAGAFRWRSRAWEPASDCAVLQEFCRERVVFCNTIRAMIGE